jgi:hypothetical protein
VCSPILSGTHLGPYEITGQIGAGGMGDVYRGRVEELKRLVPTPWRERDGS